MPETWFTSDTHYGHKNILLFEKEARPFDTIEEMNEALISNYNSVVGDQDIVYHLGDFAFGQRHIDIAGRLKGQKRLVLGNHDTYPCESYLRYFTKLYGVKYWEKCILSHMPIHMYNSAEHLRSYKIRGANFLNVHGHLHSKKIMYHIDRDGETYPDWKEEDLNYFNVSVEQHGLTPVNADIIRDRVKLIQD